MLGRLLSMNATISRRPDGSADDWGQPTTLPPEVLPDTVRCYVYSKRREDVDDVGKHAVVGELRMITGPTAAILEGDLLVVRNRRTNALLYDGLVALPRQLKSAGSRVAHASFQLARNR